MTLPCALQPLDVFEEQVLMPLRDIGISLPFYDLKSKKYLSVV